MIKHAVILAGGKGTRLRPYTWVLPKPLMPIGEQPILEVVVRQLAYFGFDRITMAVNHQAEMIKAFFGSGEKWGVAIDYSMEDTPLGTMGPLKLIKDLSEYFLIMNGDILTDLNFDKLYTEHVSNERLFTISAYERQQLNDYGVLEVDHSQSLIGFREKPVVNHLVSMGIYIASRKILDFIPDNKPYGFDTLMHDLMASEQKVKVEPFNGYWLDIGRPDDYAKAIDEFETMRSKFIYE